MMEEVSVAFHPGLITQLLHRRGGGGPILCGRPRVCPLRGGYRAYELAHQLIVQNELSGRGGRWRGLDQVPVVQKAITLCTS